MPETTIRPSGSITKRFIRKYVIKPGLRFLPKRYKLPLAYYNLKRSGHLEPEMAILPDLVGMGELALDIGANIGLFSYVLAKLCRQVIAFEPNPECASVLRAYGAPNVRVENSGLSTEPGTLELHIPVLDGHSTTAFASFAQTYGNEKKVTVPVKRLDDYGFTGVSFVKIDVEGFETEVLAGGAETFKREMPAILIEIEQRHLDFPMTDVFNKILGWGYSGWFLQDGTLHPLAKFSYQTHQKPFVADYETNPSYINNFIFRK